MQVVSYNLRKYQTANPVVRHLIRRFLRRLLQEVSNLQPQTVIDLGCGEGVIAHVLLTEMRHLSYVGYDRSPAAIEEAERRNPRVQFRQVDLLDLGPADHITDLILCLEVLEHVKDTEGFLRHVVQLRGRNLIFSVPWEPFFRIGNLCRGLHLRRLGNHPEHVHCFSKRSLARTLSRHYPHVRIEGSFPWLFGICQSASA
jgi:SAM-dependent methyltransferase